MLLPEDFLHDPGPESIGYREDRNHKYILSKLHMRRHKQLKLEVDNIML
jgi:hypothetical protein